MIKPLIHTTIMGLLLTTSMATAQATGVLKNAKVPHLTTATALPSNARVPFAKYRFGIHVSGYSLSQLTISIPKQIKVNSGISITDEFGEKIASSTTFEGGKAIISFAQPVAVETTLKITLNGVRTSTFSSQVWLFPITGRGAKMAVDIPLGMARITTYD